MAFHRLEGSINVNYFLDAVAQQEGADRLNQRVGPIWQIEEISLVDEMKKRMEAIDWEAKKTAAVQRFWGNQRMYSLPRQARTSSGRLIRPCGW